VGYKSAKTARRTSSHGADGEMGRFRAAPANTEAQCQDVTVTLETGEADTRPGQQWLGATRARSRHGSVEFEMLWEPAETGFRKIPDRLGQLPEIGWLSWRTHRGTGSSGRLQLHGHQLLAIGTP